MFVILEVLQIMVFILKERQTSHTFPDIVATHFCLSFDRSSELPPNLKHPV